MLRGVPSQSAPPKTLDERRARNAASDALIIKLITPILKAMGTSATSMKLGGIDVLEVLPPDYKDDGTTLIYIHGGGFVSFSAHSSLLLPSAMAKATEKRVVSIDYTLAPEAQWPVITDQVIAVYKALLAQGRSPASIGIFGDSAGANLTAGSVLKLRDQGIAIPGALYLISPVTDLNGEGDTRVTLAAADPALAGPAIKINHALYAPVADWNKPYVSPVFGDFKKPYPPVLLQAGTKEILLSDAVRLNRAIKNAGGRSELDVYEGMPHAFTGGLIGTPEGNAAIAEAAAFWRLNLRPRP